MLPICLPSERVHGVPQVSKIERSIAEEEIAIGCFLVMESSFEVFQ